MTTFQLYLILKSFIAQCQEKRIYLLRTFLRTVTV